ncbi:adenomatous polyposis coli protein-related protein 1 [Ditylenchus destructor]|uniref:Adenomatous polyposis coli protein-related protein 1 n=1 Tax=Ditylenchus destructor TaxID=166010 RepID=A0AAD4R4K5_9BILA|nr:adenomatous polyposis coli protein-related protein 1 [Ditylenchus destructor]
MEKRDAAESVATTSKEQNQDMYHTAEENDMSTQTLVAKMLQCVHMSAIEDYTDDFMNIFRLLKASIVADLNEKRRKDSLIILKDAYDLCCQIFYLQRCASDAMSYKAYADNTVGRLAETVERSFVPEFRRIQISMGFVDILSELFVIEVETFGYQVDVNSMCRTIRRAMGNGLINLTYRHRESKQKLCSHKSFLMHVTGIISEVPTLAQYYAGLIRNLSWNADQQMANALKSSVPALVRAALQAHTARDHKCLLAVLSALWNLASHSTDNKCAMCQEVNFLKLLVELLVDDPNMTLLVESASGILKYLCSYIKDQPQLLKFLINQPADQPNRMIGRLILLLNSSQFTVILNCLGSLCFLSQHDKIVQSQLLSNSAAMFRLNQLKNSAKEEIATAVKGLLNNLHNGAASLPPISHGHRMAVTPSSGTRATRSVFEDNHGGPFSVNPSPFFNKNHGLDSNNIQQSFAPSFETFSSTLPRSLQNNRREVANMGRPMVHSLALETKPQSCMSQNDTLRSMSVPRYINGSGQGSSSAEWRNQEQNPDATELLDQNVMAEQYEPFISEPTIEAGTDMTESMQCTRTGSVQSLNLTGVRNTEVWPSTVTSGNQSRNSGTQSPASLSELPDSPSQCATHVPFLQLSSSTSGGTNTVNEDQNSLKRETSPKTGTQAKNDDLAQINPENNRPCVVDETLLSNMINMVLPKPTNSRLYQPNHHRTHKSPSKNNDKDRLLNESIAAVMPSRLSAQLTHTPVAVPGLSPRKFDHSYHPRSSTSSLGQQMQHNTTPQNCSLSGATIDIDWDDTQRLDPLEDSLPNNKKRGQNQGSPSKKPKNHKELSQSGHANTHSNTSDSFYEAMKNSSLLESPRTKEKIRDASRLQQQAVSMSSSSSEDNYNLAAAGNTIEIGLPEDVARELQAEQLFVDCKSICSATKQRKSNVPLTKSVTNNSSAIPRKSTLQKSQTHTPKLELENVRRDSKKRNSGSEMDRKSHKPSNLVVKSPNKSNQLSTMRAEANSASSAVKKIPPPVAPKPANLLGSCRLPTPTKSARVSPFNYRQPLEAHSSQNVSTKSDSVTKDQHNAKTSAQEQTGPTTKERLFVTTV